MSILVASSGSRIYITNPTGNKNSTEEVVIFR